MKLKLLILSTLFITLGSCTKIVMVIYGIKQPEYTSNEEVVSYANKVLDYKGDILRISSYTGEEDIPFDITTLPTIRIMDSSTIYEFETSCTGDIDSKMELLNLDEEKLRVVRDYKRDEWGERLNSIKEENIATPEKMTVAIFYANYLGKLNKNHVDKWIESISLNNEVPFVLINCDLSE